MDTTETTEERLLSLTEYLQEHWADDTETEEAFRHYLYNNHEE